MDISNIYIISLSVAVSVGLSVRHSFVSSYVLELLTGTGPERGGNKLK